MSDYTTTPNLGLYKPTFNADVGNWGQHWNTNADTLDSALATSGGTFLPLAGGTMTGPLTINYAYPSALTAFEVDIARNNTSATFPPLFVVNSGVGGSATSSGGQPPSYFTFNTNSDNLASAPAGGAYNFMTGMTVQSGATGDRAALFATVNRTQASTNTANAFYVAGLFWSSAQANDGGTVATPLGSVLGINPLAQLTAGATHYQSLAAAEFNINAVTGCNVDYKTGISIIQGGNSAVQGNVHDIALLVANNSTGGTAAGWKFGISFGSPIGWWAIDAAGTMIGTNPSMAGGPSYQAARGIDFRAVTFSTAAFASNGFTVAQNGTVTANTLTSSGDVNVANGSHLWVVPGVVGMSWSGAAVLFTHTVTGPTLILSGALGAWGATPPAARPTVTGAKGSNAALASLMTALAAYGLVTDSTTA